MQYVVTALPFVLVAGIVALILAPLVRRRVTLPRRPARARRPKKSTLRDVSRDQMDEDLQELIRRR
jgi:hypothetical protein